MSSKGLSELVVFLAVVDAASFVGGGRALGMSRSAASKAVGRLEERLGVRLLQRTTRAVSLTDEGRTFHDHALTAAAALQEAEASVVKGTGMPRGVLRLTAPHAFGRRIILPLLGEFLAAWPEIQAEASFTDSPVDIVERGLDLAFRIDATSVDPEFVSRVVARYERVLVASPAYLRERGDPKDLSDLPKHEALLFMANGRQQAWNLELDGSQLRRVQVRSRLRLDSGDALRDAAVAGHGIALLPIFLVADELEDGTLLRLLPDAVAQEVEVVALYPSRKYLESRVRQFIDLVAGRTGPTRALENPHASTGSHTRTSTGKA